MRQVTPAWKLVTAVVSLLLTLFVWQQGLQESLKRPSVASQLSINQHEMALVASPALPESLKPILVGLNPRETLKQSLLEIPEDKIEDRQRLLVATLEQSEVKRQELLDFSLKDQELLPLQKALLNSFNGAQLSTSNLAQIESLKKDPLLYQVSCLSLGGNDASCVDQSVSKSMALRLVGIQVFPLLATVIGFVLLLGQLWLIFRRKNTPWPDLSTLPLSLVDMILLISGGFVLLGEVLFPTLLIPLSSYFTKQFSSPMNEALKVFIGYISMTLPPLFILYQQLRGLKIFERPPGGWLQWNLKPLNTSLSYAVRGWLMILPFVLLTGWLINSLVGDQGGSNPLLDLVLNSHNLWALILLLTTTVVLAPFFEELIFRGVLLPVLAKDLGRFWAVIVSSLVFALAHLSIGELPALFVLGLGLGFVRLSSGRLFSCAIMHSLWNGITFANLLLLNG